jgi:hypothetical protein
VGVTATYRIIPLPVFAGYETVLGVVSEFFAAYF